MKWINKNKDRYVARMLKPVVFSLLFFLVLILIFSLIENSFSYELLPILLMCLYVPVLALWAKMAKYNIQSIEIFEEILKIHYFKYNKNVKFICKIKKIQFKLRSKYQSLGYWSIYCNDNLILKQEAEYWESDLNLLELHEELKKHLPKGCVVTV